jgi:glyoxylase-like metal-dependent hydrolase (beta-lactamase superfamily II)
MAHMALLGLPRELFAAPAAVGGAIRVGSQAAEIVAREAWGTLYRVAEGVFALISDPFAEGGAGRVTLCNGGFVAGSRGVMMVEAFASAEGSAWLASQAREITGRDVTHLVVTHYHGDHTGGLGGIETGGRPLQLLSTARTRDLLANSWGEDRGGRPLPDGSLHPIDAAEVDLGGRIVRLVPRDGHTPSDVTVEVDSADGGKAVFCGDLVWKDMFPNFVDTLPGRLTQSVRAIGAQEGVIYVPGHGQLADASDLTRFAAVLQDVEARARGAAEAGIPVAEAAAAYEVPAELGEWFRFSANYYERAFRAWYRSMGVAG